MCGIFSYIGGNTNLKSLIHYFKKISHRGPDSTHITKIKDDIIFGFHRLAINGLDRESDQPLCIDGIHLICNGEIYNYKQLLSYNEFKYNTRSDCEIIIHMYKQYGIKETCNQLDGVFAFVLYDENKNKLYAARDRYGVRSMFYGLTENITDFYISSEMKAITFCKTIQQFPPSCYWDYDNKNNFINYHIENISVVSEIPISIEDIKTNIKKLFINAVKKRMMSDRKICCLLSGGLDSTLTTAILCSLVDDPKQINTYSIGIEGSENDADLYYAKKAADYLGTTHSQIIVSEKDFCDAIEKTIYQIESYCTTTVRASVGNYLVSLYIKNTNIDKDISERDTVVFCGDFADEIWGSYQGMKATTNPEDFLIENRKLVDDCHYFDLLRSDKSISGASLEARVPFADKDFVEYVMKIDPKLKMFNGDKLEKQLMRESFHGILPDELLYRRKVAFSDGVSSQTRNWFTIIHEHIENIIKNTDIEKGNDEYHFTNPPYDRESFYYRMLFEKYYKNHGNVIPYYWRHPFSKNLDPSARLLDYYKE
jgi:asparagine synthase (glutamine-hydrolysing)